jgi:hypothetical protein
LREVRLIFFWLCQRYLFLILSSPELFFHVILRHIINDLDLRRVWPGC